MAKCPVCETNTTTHYVRGFIVGILLGLLIGFVAGQLFHSWEYGRIAGQKIEKLESKNQELEKGYVPPRQSVPQKTK